MSFESSVNAILRIVLAAFAFGEVAWGQLPFSQTSWKQFPGSGEEFALTMIDFEQYGAGGAYSSAWGTPLHRGVNIHGVSGPGMLGIGPATGFGIGNVGYFSGFESNGGQGQIDMGLSVSGLSDTFFSRLTFDAFSTLDDAGNHGPTSFYVTANFGRWTWTSETVTVIPGVANSLRWDISNPDADKSDGDGIEVLPAYTLAPGTPDWRSLSSTTWETKYMSFTVHAGGANSENAALVLDNIQTTGFVVPEPTSAILVCAAAMWGMFVRRKRE